MASPWQHSYPGESKPVVPTDTGYHVNLPDEPSRKYRASEHHYTVYLEDQDGKGRYLYAHEIGMNFQVGGSYAQSPQFRAWYPRNFIQPIIQVTGQTSSQADYAAIAEFIHKAQQKSLRWDNSDSRQNTIHMRIPSTHKHMDENHQHTGHSVNGHIRQIQRLSERWINAPEFTFEFVVVTAHAGLYEIKSSDASGTKNEIGAIMRISEADQIRNRNRTGTVVDWAMDPDKGSDAAGYTKGTGKPD